LGYTLNMSVKFGTSRKDYHDLFTQSLERCADKIKPELVILSAGFDPHVKDPIGSLGLETEDFTTMTTRVLEVAKTHCKGRLVSCLEGGYNVEILAESVQAHLEELLAFKA
jgi:acetoin utilization deacetylase AcuC-like enzyme